MQVSLPFRERSYLPDQSLLWWNVSNSFSVLVLRPVNVTWEKPRPVDWLTFKFMSTVSNDTRCCLVLLFCLRWTQLPTFQDDLHPHLVNDLHDSSRWKLSDLSPSFFFYPPSLFLVFVFPPFVLETASSSCDRQFPSSGLQVPFSPLLRDFCLELTLYFASATCDFLLLTAYTVL